MKERLDSTKILREPSVNGPGQNDIAGSVTRLEAADVKAEVKEEDGQRSCDSRSPSGKAPNGDADVTMAKSEDNNNKRIKVEKKSDNNGKMENGKPGSFGSENQKPSPQSSTGTPQLPSSGGTTPATLMPHHGLVATLEPPFMQQQSEIFVFSTQLANEAADAVRHGHCKSIIQYHVDHPNTKVFLQKNPLKAGNFRQSMMYGMMGESRSEHGQNMMRMLGPSPASWGPQQALGMEEMMAPDGMMPNGPYHPGGHGPKMMGGGWQGCGGYHPHPHGSMGPGGYPPGNMMDMDNEMMMMRGPHNTSSLASNQIPDENLTIEQRQHRSRSLAQLTKIHKMLMGSNGQQDIRQPMTGRESHPACSGMYPGGPAMMGPQQQAMMSQGGMMAPHGMMSPQHQHMMAQQTMAPYGPRGPPGLGPPSMNGKDQYQHDWCQAQRDYYMEKQHRMQHMAANRGPMMEPGPPPPYYSTVSQKHGGICGPASPNMNGMRMPMPQHGPHGPMGPGMDHDGMGMYGGSPDMCRPPHMGMESMPGLNGYPHHMQPQGPLDPAFDSTGGMMPNMGPGLLSPGGPRHHGPIHQGHMMGSNGMMPSLKGPNQVTLHRAGNPEQFNPETMGGVVLPVPAQTNTNSSSKPPPSYAQAQKRKRGSDADDSYGKGNLQHTPSPTKIHYHLSQFEGQELTITKQLNSAYVGGGGGEEVNIGSGAITGAGSGPGLVNTGGPFNSHASSPLHGPGSNRGPHSNSSQSSVHMANSPAASTTGPSPHQGPSTPHNNPPPPSSSSASSGANMRLTHFDPSPLSNGISSSPHTSNTKSSMSNITSASLANLAKGVENLSNQMQQNMMQGGPFHSIQVQGQVTNSNGNSSNNNVNSGSSTASTTSLSSALSSTPSLASSLSSSLHPVPSTSSHTPSTVSSNFVTAASSALQGNSSNHPVTNCFPNVNSESPHMNISACNIQHGMGPHPVPGNTGGCPRPGLPHVSHLQGMMTSLGPVPGGPSPGMVPGPHMNPPHPHRPNSSSSMPATPPTMSKSHFTSPPLSHPQITGSGLVLDVTSPTFPITSNSNSSVQIQQKGHNTIQYLPANPPQSSQPSSTKQRPDFDYSMPRFPSPLPTMDGKNPTSTLQYFPNSSPTGARPPAMPSALSAAAAMGPDFASQAAIAMQQSASMMQGPSLSDIQAMQGGGPGVPPPSAGHMSPMDTPSHIRGPHMGGGGPMMGGPDPLMGGPDPMMVMSHMQPGHSPGSMHHMPPGMGPGSLECVSPIPGLGGYLNSGPSIEQAQAQAQAHAARMMQGNTQIPSSSPHGPVPPCGGPSPHMPPLGPLSSCGDPSQMGIISNNSMHGPLPLNHSVHGPSMPGQPHGAPLPNGPIPGSLPGPTHGPMPGPMQSPSLHGPMPGAPPHNTMMGPMPPHGHMRHMHGSAGMSSGCMPPRHPGMGGMRMVGPGMGSMPGQYPWYQQDYYPPGPPRNHPRPMMPGMIGGPGQPYGMMSNMPGPS